MILQPNQKKSQKKQEKAPESLVGRPLVPFFGQDEQLNMNMGLTATPSEDINVDARVWNPEGYFEYPDEAKPKDAAALNSGEMILQLLRGGGGGSNTTPSKAIEKNASQKTLSIESSSQTKASKKEPNSRKKNKKNKKKNKAEDPPSKWAWSAFQSSPDPKTLPMPSMAPLNGRRFSEDDDLEGSAFVLDKQPDLFHTPPSKATILAAAQSLNQKTPISTAHPDAIPLPPPPPPNTPATTAPSESVQDMTSNLRKLLNLNKE